MKARDLKHRHGPSDYTCGVYVQASVCVIIQLHGEMGSNLTVTQKVTRLRIFQSLQKQWKVLQYILMRGQ